MSDIDVPVFDVAVALILDSEQRLLWAWNRGWGVFAWPMTKVRPGESALQAAERAAAEVLGVPVQARKRLKPRADLYVSERDGTMKLYRYHVCRAEAHERFRKTATPVVPHIWLTASESLSGEYRPLSEPCLELAGQLQGEGVLPGRSQLTSALVIARGPQDEPSFLLRWNDHWGYALPTKRRRTGDDLRSAAGRVASDELGLNPATDLHLTPAQPQIVPLEDTSASVDVPTHYYHSVYRGELADGARLRSSAPLVWVTVADVVRGATDASRTESGSPTAPPGKISPTVRRILEALWTF